VIDFWAKLFDTSDFPARWNCGHWTPGHGWLHILSDLGIWSAYFAIPCVLVYFILRRRDLPFRGIFFLFVAFILLCGTTHLMEAIIFYWPGYRVAGLIKLATAAVSWFTVLSLVQIAPTAMSLKSPEELQREIDARVKAELALKRANEELENRVEERTKELAAANQALYREREWLKTIVASIGDAVITTDIDGQVSMLNRVAESITGWKSQDAVDQPLESVFHIVNETTRQPGENPAERALKEGRIVGLANHTLLIAKDGTERPIDDSAAPIRSNDGETIGSVLVFRDVSERRQAERELHESRERIQLAQWAAGIGIYDYDVPANQIRWDERVRGIWGVGPDEEINYQTFLDGLHPDDVEMTQAAVDKSLDPGGDGKYYAEYRVIHRETGDIRWVSAAGETTFESGRAVRLIGAAQDVTHLKQTEAALRQSEARFSQLADNIDQFAWMADENGDIVWYNQRWYDYTGTTFEEMKGWGWKKVHHPEHIDRVVEKISHCFETGKTWEDTFPLRSKEGTYHWFLSRAIPHCNTEGRVERWFGTNTDITEQLETQEKLRQLTAKLSEAARRKDEFLAILAHELRNPLAPIRTGMELLDVLKDDSERVQEVRGTIERQVQQLVTLVDDLLDVSRITQGKFQLRKQPVTLQDVIQSAVEEAQPVIDKASHDFSATVPDAAVQLNADPHRLAQVFSNLLNNAAKYTPEGGTIRLAVHREEDDVVVTVEDNGIGIPPEKIEQIFEMFSQVGESTDHGSGGLGIGLTLVKALVEMHGGSISVSSDGPNAGSRFTVRLPLLTQEYSADHPGREDSDSISTSARVMVVDDNEAAAKMLSMLVKTLGCEVRVASDGQQAVSLAAEFLPDLVLMDIGMPKMNGYEAARHIRREPWGQSMMLVALTGWGQDDDKQRTREAGFDRHLVKPAEPTDLRKLILEASEKGYKDDKK